jgi:hypothetical protein
MVRRLSGGRPIVARSAGRGSKHRSDAAEIRITAAEVARLIRATAIETLPVSSLHPNPRNARRLSLPKSRFVRIDGAARQGLDAQQCLRTARFGACKARPFLAKREYALHYNR